MGFNNGIRAIFYDLDGTLRISRPKGRELFADHVASLGFPVSVQDRQRAARWENYYWAQSAELREDENKFSDANAFYHNYSRRHLLELGLDENSAREYTQQMHQFMSENWASSDHVPEELPGTLEKLRAAGYRLGVISNRSAPFDDRLKIIGLDQYFEFALAAVEANSWKPDAGVFLHGARMAEVSADEVIYVGDNYYADVVGARNAGMNPVLYDTDNLFEEPGCPVITTHDQIFDVLERM